MGIQNPIIKRSALINEFLTDEGCRILEIANDPDDEDVSIARARVKTGVTTQWHQLKGIDERYLIISGHGLVEVRGIDPTTVIEGDVVCIPADTPQRITNTGKDDLIFYCVCSPRFRVESYSKSDK